MLTDLEKLAYARRHFGDDITDAMLTLRGPHGRPPRWVMSYPGQALRVMVPGRWFGPHESTDLRSVCPLSLWQNVQQRAWMAALSWQSIPLGSREQRAAFVWAVDSPRDPEARSAVCYLLGMPDDA